MGQGVGHEVLQPYAIHDDDVGGLDGLHIVDGEGVVVEAGNLPLNQQVHLYPIHPLGDGGGKQIDGIGGAQDPQSAALRGGGGGRLPPAAGGEQEQRGQENGRQRFFHANTS